MKKPASNPYRLDRNLKPLLYTIKLEPDLEHFTFRGEETVTFEASEAFSRVTLHAVDLRVTRAALLVAGSEVPSKKITYDEKFETVTLDFGRTFKPGQAKAVVLEFEGTLNDKMHGFYRTAYFVDGQKRWGAATQFEATDARRAFPCWDEPDLKAQFRVTLIVPDRLTALSNMPVIDEKPASAGLKVVDYQTSPVMSTYLVCFVVADLEFLEGIDKNGIPIRVYTTPGRREQGRFALEVALHTLPYFSEWFGIAYALPKLDMVALPDFASGAMENWGLVTYRETALLVDRDHSSAAARQRVAEVIDHELAHQWFGNLVTMEWWTDLWLNEGFASYMGPKAVDHQFPDWKIWNQFIATEYLVALRDDSLKSSHPIEIPVKNPHEIREIFDHITYAKGSSVNRMLEHALSEEKFREGLGVYLNRYAFGNARTEDLWDALEEVSGKPVKSMMASFTRQQGYPVLGVTEKASEKTVTLEIEQKRFIFDGSVDPTKPLWSVPIGIAAEGLRKPEEAFMKGQKTRVRFSPKPGAWIKLNPGQSGFYRVAYPPALMTRLTDAIAAGELPAIDCLGVVDDVFVLARAGHLRTSQVLALLAGCRAESDYNVWVTVSSILGAIENILPESEKGAFTAYAAELFHPLASKLGWNPRLTDSHLDLLLRSLVISRRGHFGHAETVEKARERFEKFLEKGKLDPNLRGAVYGIVAEHGGEAELESLWKLYREGGLQEEKVRVLRSLTRFRQKKIIEKVLRWALTADVRSQDKYVIFAGFGSNVDARRLNWEFVKSQWKMLTSLFGGGNLGLFSHIIEGSTSGFTTSEAFADARDFFADHPVPGTERAMKQSLEVIGAHIRWARRDAGDIGGFFAKQPDETAAPKNLRVSKTRRV